MLENIEPLSKQDNHRYKAVQQLSVFFINLFSTVFTLGLLIVLLSSVKITNHRHDLKSGGFLAFWLVILSPHEMTQDSYVQ